MGTGKSGRYLSTEGSRIHASEFAVVHSIEGRFVRSGKRGEKLRLAAGCHGQAGMELLDKYGIEYNITHTYPIGVRIGNVPWHKAKKKKTNNLDKKQRGE